MIYLFVSLMMSSGMGIVCRDINGSCFASHGSEIRSGDREESCTGRKRHLRCSSSSSSNSGSSSSYCF